MDSTNSQRRCPEKLERSIVKALEARRLGLPRKSVRNMYRYNNLIMKKLLSSPQWTFDLVGKLKTQGSVDFECPDKLYTDNNRKCYSLRGPKCEPVLTYTINRDATGRSNNVTYWDNITITRAGLANPNPPPFDIRLLLTSERKIEVRKEATGELVHVVNLIGRGYSAPNVDFRDMRWDLSLDQIVVSSTRSQSRSSIACHFVVLDFCPHVVVKYRFAISRSVFGRNVRMVNLYDGLLQIFTTNRIVHIFDFEQIVGMNGFSDEANRVLDLKHIPEPVLTIPETSYQIFIGGFPWQYIKHLPRTKVYEVYSLDHKFIASIKNAQYEDTESIYFHPDDSGVIIRPMPNKLLYLKVVADEENPRGTLKTIREFKIVGQNVPKRVTANGDRSSSGGRLRRSRRISDMYVATLFGQDNAEDLIFKKEIFADDYENELNVHSLLGIDSCDPAEKGVLQIFDSGTGELLNSIRFNNSLDEFVRYRIIQDLDILIMTCKQEGSSRSDTLIFRLCNVNSLPEERRRRNELPSFDLPAGPLIVDLETDPTVIYNF